MWKHSDAPIVHNVDVAHHKIILCARLHAQTATNTYSNQAFSHRAQTALQCLDVLSTVREKRAVHVEADVHIPLVWDHFTNRTTKLMLVLCKS